MSSKSFKNGAYEILVIQKDAITKITGIMTPKSINTLKNELGGAFTILKSTHFAKGEQCGYLACIITEEKCHIVVADPMWVYMAPVDPDANTAAALAAGVSAAHQEQITAQHKKTQMAYTKYLGAQEAGKELLLYSISNGALALLKKPYINFGKCNHPLNDTTPL
jgi:hypothetical protein